MDTVEMRHPDSPNPIFVARPAVRVYRAKGFLPLDEYEAQAKAKPRSRRASRPEPMAEAVEADVAALADIAPTPPEAFTHPT